MAWISIADQPIPDTFPAVPDLPDLYWEEHPRVGQIIKWRNGTFSWSRIRGWNITAGSLTKAEDRIWSKAMKKLAQSLRFSGGKANEAIAEAATYDQAREALMKELEADGWAVVRTSNVGKPLLVPHATRGDIRLFFKKQSVYYVEGEPRDLNRAHSFNVDLKKLTAKSIDQMLRESVEEWIAGVAEARGIAYITGDDAEEEIDRHDLFGASEETIAAWLKANFARIKRMGWIEGGENDDDYESTAYRVTIGGKPYTVRVGRELLSVMQESTMDEKQTTGWRTTDGGHHIYLSKGSITKGNPHMMRAVAQNLSPEDADAEMRRFFMVANARFGKKGKGGEKPTKPATKKSWLANLLSVFGASGKDESVMGGPLADFAEAASGSGDDLSESIPSISKWLTFAGGTGAAPDKYSYSWNTAHGTYHIWPVSNTAGRHIGYSVKFANQPDPRRDGKSLGQGLWIDLGRHKTPATAARVCREHDASIDATPSTTQEAEAWDGRVRPTKASEVWAGWSDWTPHERIVFSATVELKAGYAGEKDHRFNAASKLTGMTREQWDAASAELKKRGVFNAAGAVKPAWKTRYYNERRWTGPQVSQRIGNTVDQWESLTEADSADAEVIDGMARALFVTAWADQQEQDGASFSGMDIEKEAPKTSRAAMSHATKLAKQFSAMNNGMSVGELFTRAEEDGFYTRPTSDNLRSQESLFGWYLAMRAMGHGVSWDDNAPSNATLKIKHPHTEFYESIDEADLNEARIAVRLTANTGDTWATEINGTLSTAKDYFLNKTFNIGIAGRDKMVRVVKVELLDTDAEPEESIDEADGAAIWSDEDGRQELIARLEKEIPAGYVKVQGKQTVVLGLPDSGTIYLDVAVEPKEEWPNGIFHNAQHSLISIEPTGEVKQIAFGYKMRSSANKLRKFRAKSAADVVTKLVAYFSKIAPKSESIEDANAANYTDRPLTVPADKRCKQCAYAMFSSDDTKVRCSRFKFEASANGACDAWTE